MYKKLIAKIEQYGFECEAGSLQDCKDWQVIKEKCQEPSNVRQAYYILDEVHSELVQNNLNDTLSTDYIMLYPNFREDTSGESIWFADEELFHSSELPDMTEYDGDKKKSDVLVKDILDTILQKLRDKVSVFSSVILGVTREMEKKKGE